MSTKRRRRRRRRQKRAAKFDDLHEMGIDNYEIQNLIYNLRRLAPYRLPHRVETASYPGHVAEGLAFTPNQKKSMRRLTNYTCEVESCRASGKRACITTHHIKFRRDRGKGLLINAETLCLDCHNGGHGTKGHTTTGKGCRTRHEGAIAVSGVPMRVTFKILNAFEEEGLLKVRVRYGMLEDIFRKVAPSHRNRRTVIGIHLSGSGLSEFRLCQSMLSRVVKMSKIGGRFTPKAERMILQFVQNHFLPPHCDSLLRQIAA